MARRHRLIKKALKSLNFTYDNSQATYPLNTMKDLDFLVKEKQSEKDSLEDQKLQLQVLIMDCDELIKIKEGDLNDLKLIKDQIEIEEYQELNPGKNIIKL